MLRYKLRVILKPSSLHPKGKLCVTVYTMEEFQRPYNDINNIDRIKRITLFKRKISVLYSS